MDPLLGGLVTSAAGSLFDYITGTARANQQFKHNKQLMQFQYDLNQQSIDKQNAYNSPANQMRLYQAAGINPYAVIGNINSRQPASGNVGLGSVQQAKSTNFLADYNAALQAQLTRAQIQKVKADTTGQNIQNERDQGTLQNDIQFSNLRVEREGQNIKIGNRVLDEKQLDIESKRIDNYIAENSKDALISINWTQSRLLKLRSTIESTEVDIAAERLQQIMTQNDVLAVTLAQNLEILNKMQMENEVYAAISTALIQNAYLDNERVKSEISKNYSMSEGFSLDNAFKSNTLYRRIEAQNEKSRAEQVASFYSAELAKDKYESDLINVRETAKQNLYKTVKYKFDASQSMSKAVQEKVDADLKKVDKFFDYLETSSKVMKNFLPFLVL